MADSQVHIVIVDDNPLYRETIRKVLENQLDLKVVAEVGDGQYAIQAIKKHRPDVVLMDITMPYMDGLETTKIIRSRFPDTRVIMLSMHSDHTMTASSYQAGACSYLCKDCNQKEIIAAIREEHHKRSV